MANIFNQKKGKPALTREVVIPEPKKPKKKNPQVEKAKLISRKVVKIFSITVGVIVLILGILVALAAIYEDSITRALIKELNKNLKKEIVIKDVDLNLVRSFPNASVNLRGVTVPGAFDGSLLRAELIAFKFNVFSLLGKTYKIKSIVVNDGLLNIKKNKKGENNYDILKSTADKDTTDNEAVQFSIRLNSTVFEKIDLHYDDALKNNQAGIFLEYFDLQGNFSDKRTALKSTAEMRSNFIAFGGDRYLPNALVGWDLAIDADFEKGVYKIDPSRVDLQSNTFKASGTVTEIEDLLDLDVALKGEDCTIYSVIAMLPNRYKEAVKDFNSRGDFYFNIAVKGKYGDALSPAVNAEFGLKGGQITSPRLGESLKDVNFAATFASKENQDSAVFNMKGFEATLNKRLLSLDVRLENIADPRIDFRFNGDVDLALVYKLSNNDFIKNGEGLIKFQDLLLKGRYKDMVSTSSLTKVDASGIVDFQGFKINYAGEEFRLQDGYITFTNELITARAMKLVGLGSDFLLNLNLYNVLPTLFADDAAKKKVYFDGEMRSDNMDFDKILALALKVNETNLPENPKTPVPKSDTLTEKDGSSLDYYFDALQGKFRADIKKFNFRKIAGKNFAGEVEYNNKELAFKNISVDAIDGRIKMSSNIRLKGAPKVEAFFEFTDIDGKRLLTECENFGQTVLIDDNLKGRMDAKMIMEAHWDKAYNFLDKDLYVLMDLTVSEGELLNFKMMEDFSKYVKLEDLQHIKFENMRNQIEIKNRQLILPSMFLQSNALNMTLAGIYDFDDNMDFKFKINGAQVLREKFKRFNPDLLPKKAKKDGWFNLYVGMKGNLYGELEMKYRDKKEVNLVLEEKLKIEFQDIQNTIKSKFDAAPIEEPLDWEDDDNDDDSGDFGDF